MIKRIITALAIIAVAVPTIYFGGTLFLILATAFATVACNEILKLVDQKWPIALKAIIYGLFVVSALLLKLNNNYLLIESIVLLVILSTALVFNENVTIEQIGLVYFFFNIVLITISAFYKMYEINKMLIFFMLIATYMTDTFALFGGMAFGKHKLNERISPKKTIEGSISGWLVGGVSATLFGYFALKGINMPFIVISAFTLTIIGQIGDLLFSAIKRHYGIKDFGKIFPGHGGVLDRIDSLTLNSMWLLMLITVML